MQACGVCHTDLHYREGAINDDFPFLLGHEAAGVVEAVGPDVTSVAPGDFVILNWRAVCGECRVLPAGPPWYCFDTHNATQKMTLPDGTELSPALGIGAFAEKTLVAAGQATKVDPAAVADRRRAARLRRDGGARRGDAHRQRVSAATRSRCSAAAASATPRSSVRALAGATKVIAVDLDPRKLEIGEAASGRRTPSTRPRRTRSRRSRRSPTATAPTSCIEAVGHPEVMKQAFYARDLAGTLVQVGRARPDDDRSSCR